MHIEQHQSVANQKTKPSDLGMILPVAAIISTHHHHLGILSPEADSLFTMQLSQRGLCSVQPMPKAVHWLRLFTNPQTITTIITTSEQFINTNWSATM